MRPKRKKDWGYSIIEDKVEKNWVILYSMSYLYWWNRNNKLRIIKASNDNKNNIKQMFKQIFYPLKLQDEPKTNIINREEY